MLPSIPNDSTGVNRIFIFKVETIQVRMITATVPPSSFIASGTVGTSLVIVVVFSRKGHPIVQKQCITGVSTL